MKRKYFNYKIPIYLFFILFSLAFILPLILLISISFSTEGDISRYGYSLIPKTISTMAYAFVFKNPSNLINAYLVTIAYAFLGTALSVAMMAMTGYALSREGFVYKKIVSGFLLVTMFFSGGLIPSYIINTQFYGLQNNFLIYIVSGMASAYTIFVFRTFFAQLPKSLIESALLDGAGEFRVLRSVILPLSKPVLATFFMFGLLSRWQNFEVSLYYITDSRFYSIQYLLQLILNESRMIEETLRNIPGVYIGEKPPGEIIKFAICVLGTIPIAAVFPFFQKYFSKGMVVGSVKG